MKELYEYITLLSEEIDGAGYFMPHRENEPPLDWIQTIRRIPDMIHDLSAKMDKHDQDFLDMIVAIKDWMNKYGPVLDKMNSEIESGKARVQALDRKSG